MVVAIVAYREAWNIAFKTLKLPWKIWKYKSSIYVYLEENEFRDRKEGSQFCIISFYSKYIPTLVKK